MTDRRAIPRVFTRYEEIQPYLTKDGSVIRELMHPHVHGNQSISVAEATVEPGAGTDLHVHHRSEEIYHVTRGAGMMFLEGDEFPIEKGDTLCIKPGQPHRVDNTGNIPLKILCCCSPPYAHDDTEIVNKTT